MSTRYRCVPVPGSWIGHTNDPVGVDSPSSVGGVTPTYKVPLCGMIRHHIPASGISRRAPTNGTRKPEPGNRSFNSTGYKRTLDRLP